MTLTRTRLVTDKSVAVMPLGVGNRKWRVRQPSPAYTSQPNIHRIKIGWTGSRMTARGYQTGNLLASLPGIGYRERSRQMSLSAFPESIFC